MKMKIFSFSLCLFTLIFDLSNQFLKNNKLRNLDDEKSIIEIEITGAEGEVTFINNDYDILDKIAKIIVNGEEMTEKKNSISVNANENYTITIQFQNGYEEYCPYMFSRLYKIKKIKFKNFKGCTNTESMFNQCSSLESLDLSSFDTSKVTNMRAMFAGCSSLKFLDLTSFDTSNVNSMNVMFSECSSLESLDLSSFNTSKVTSMNDMFYSCSSLEYLDLSSFDTSNVEEMSRMFKYSSYMSLDLSSFNTSKAAYMDEMFYKCYYLYELVLSSSFTMEKVEKYGNMFSNYYISVTQNGANLKDDVINEIDSTNSIRDLKKNLILITINTAENKNLKFINYDGTENMIMLQNDAPIDFTNNINVNAGMTVIKLLFPEDSNKISCEGLFKNIPEITKIAFINFDICNNAKEMFSGCSNLEKLNLKLFATSEITDMNGMFSGCSNLKTLGVSSFDISKSEDVDNMFCGCDQLNDVVKKSFGRTFFKCDDCDASKPFLIEYTSKCVENCGDSYYLLEEENICVSNCTETDYNYAIEEEKKCVKDCSETDYKYTIEEENKCVKECDESNYLKQDNK